MLVLQTVLSCLIAVISNVIKILLQCFPVVTPRWHARSSHGKALLMVNHGEPL